MPITNQRWMVVLPCHNKGTWIVESVHDAIRSFGDSLYSVVIVENGSTDESSLQIKRLPDRIGNICLEKVFLSERGLGRAFAAIQSHVQEFEGWVVLASADSPFGTSDLEAFKSSVQRNPRDRILVASKRHPESVITRKRHRAILTWSFAKIREALFATSLSDTQSTQCYPANVLRRFLPHVQSKHFFFRTELLLLCEWLGIPTEEVPVRLRLPESPTTVRIVGDSIQFVKELVQLRLRLLWNARLRQQRALL